MCRSIQQIHNLFHKQPILSNYIILYFSPINSFAQRRNKDFNERDMQKKGRDGQKLKRFKTENTFFVFPAVFYVLYGSLKSPRARISSNCTIKSMDQTPCVRGKMGQLEALKGSSILKECTSFHTEDFKLPL